MTRRMYDVTIDFSDGTFHGRALAEDQYSAEHIILQDARLETPEHRCYAGRILSVCTREEVAA